MGDWVDTCGTGMDRSSTDSKDKRGYLWDKASEGSLEGVVGGDRYPYLNSTSIPRFFTGFYQGGGGGPH